MAGAIYPKRLHRQAFEYLVSTMFREFGAPLQEGQLFNRNDMFTKSTLDECNRLDDPDQVHDALPRVVVHVGSLLNELNVAITQNEE